MKTFIKRVKKNPNSSSYYSIYTVGSDKLFLYRVEKWSGKAFADEVTTLSINDARRLLNVKDSKVPEFVLKEITKQP
jgi:hypothetical protein